mmetsp:Transcript_27053/g.41571  ORF Transcript_27053/g.41571 Transcript_27053/m.41571 type:complete len:227 (+) Transcript_27053:9-689(+)
MFIPRPELQASSRLRVQVPLLCSFLLLLGPERRSPRHCQGCNVLFIRRSLKSCQLVLEGSWDLKLITSTILAQKPPLSSTGTQLSSLVGPECQTLNRLFRSTHFRLDDKLVRSQGEFMGVAIFGTNDGTISRDYFNTLHDVTISMDNQFVNVSEIGSAEFTSQIGPTKDTRRLDGLLLLLFLFLLFGFGRGRWNLDKVFLLVIVTPFFVVRSTLLVGHFFLLLFFG